MARPLPQTRFRIPALSAFIQRSEMAGDRYTRSSEPRIHPGVSRKADCPVRNIDRTRGLRLPPGNGMGNDPPTFAGLPAHKPRLFRQWQTGERSAAIHRRNRCPAVHTGLHAELAQSEGRRYYGFGHRRRQATSGKTFGSHLAVRTRRL